MKNKITVIMMIVTFGCWVAAVVDTIRWCIWDPELSITDSWISWAIYIAAQIIYGIMNGSFKEWAIIMKFLISENKAR